MLCMNILVINGDCIQTNTCGNLCHIAYIRGLQEAGQAGASHGLLFFTWQLLGSACIISLNTNLLFCLEFSS